MWGMEGGGAHSIVFCHHVEQNVKLTRECTQPLPLSNKTARCAGIPWLHHALFEISGDYFPCSRPERACRWVSFPRGSIQSSSAWKPCGTTDIKQVSDRAHTIFATSSGSPKVNGPLSSPQQNFSPSSRHAWNRAHSGRTMRQPDWCQGERIFQYCSFVNLREIILAKGTSICMNGLWRVHFAHCPKNTKHDDKTNTWVHQLCLRILVPKLDFSQ